MGAVKNEANNGATTMTDLNTLSLNTLDQICRDLYADIADLNRIADKVDCARDWPKRAAARKLARGIKRTIEGRLTVAACAK